MNFGSMRKGMRGGSTSARATVSKAPTALKLLMALGLVHALAWAFVVTPLTGPDEANHASYIIHLAETGHSPSPTTGDGSYSTQTSFMLVGAQIGATGTNVESLPKFNEWDGIAKAMDEASHAERSNNSGPNPVAYNPPLYYYAAAFAYKLSPDTSLPARLLWLRATTALLMPIMVLLAWLIAAEVFVASWPRVVTAAMVATQSKMAFMAGSINPDALMITFYTAVLLMSLRVVRRGPSARRLAWLGVFAGAAALTHGRGFAAVPLAALAALIGLQQAKPQLREFARKAAILGVPMVGLALVGYIYTRAHNPAGTAFGGQTTTNYAAGVPLTIRGFFDSVWQFYLPSLDFMHERLGAGVGYRQIFIYGFFGQQGSLEIEFAPKTYGYLQLVAGIGWFALFMVVVRRYATLLRRWRETAVLVGAFVSMMLLLHLSEYRAIAGGADALITGRYILPCVALYGLAIAFVANSLPGRLKPILASFAVCTGVIIALAQLGNAVERLHG